MTHAHHRQRVKLAPMLAPSRKQQAPAALRAPWPFPHLGHLEGRTLPALISQLCDAKATTAPRQSPRRRSLEAGWLGTFQAWLSGAPRPAADRVRAGVSSIGPEDRAMCWCCGPEPSRWAAGDSPTRGRCGPHSLCSHLLGQDSGSTLSWGGRDLMDGQILGQLHLLAEQAEGARATPSWSPGTLLCLRPSFPSMDSWEVRLASFCDWPLTAMVRPKLLATAGFFYSSQQDMVRCFCCCGDLWDWEQGDDPWTEHARWFPRCEFLLRIKGRDFVCSVQESCCHLPGSWDQREELEDAAPAALSAPVHPGPELPTHRRQTHSEGAREPGTQDLEEQLRRLQEERTCKVCLDRVVCTVFVPCGHLVCVQCAANLKLCPICRAPIQSCVRIFLA